MEGKWWIRERSCIYTDFSSLFFNLDRHLFLLFVILPLNTGKGEGGCFFFRLNIFPFVFVQGKRVRRWRNELRSATEEHARQDARENILFHVFMCGCDFFFSSLISFFISGCKKIGGKLADIWEEVSPRKKLHNVHTHTRTRTRTQIDWKKKIRAK